jgi:hypothetical protein
MQPQFRQSIQVAKLLLESGVPDMPVFCYFGAHSRRKIMPLFDLPPGFKWSRPRFRDVHDGVVSIEDYQLYPQQYECDTGRTYSVDYFPKFIRHRKHEKVPQDVYEENDGYRIVSRRLKERIELREPGVHQFFPVKVLNKDKTELPNEYFFFNMRNANIFSIDVENSHMLRWGNHPNPNYPHERLLSFQRQPGDEKRTKSEILKRLFWVHKASVIGKRQIWREYLRFDEPPNVKRRFVKDECGRILIAPDSTEHSLSYSLSHISDLNSGHRVSDDMYKWCAKEQILGLKFNYVGQSPLDTELASCEAASSRNKTPIQRSSGENIP